MMGLVVSTENALLSEGIVDYAGFTGDSEVVP